MAKSSKGSEFERELCKQLSLWWTSQTRNDVFWRAASSGAMATTRQKVGQGAFGQHGDIQATDPIGTPLTTVFSIEAKRGYKEATFWDVMNSLSTKAVKPWAQWFIQSIEGQMFSNALSPMLIHKTDRKQSLVYFDYKTFKLLRRAKGWAGHQRGITPFFKGNIELPAFRTYKGGTRVIVCMRLNDFLLLDPQCIVDVYNENCL